MFKIASKRTVKWPVVVNVPQDGGTTRSEKFTCEFVIMDQSVIDETLSDANSNDIAFLADVVHDWDGVVDDGSQPIDCNDDTKKMLFDIPYVRSAVLRAYFDAVNGGRRKN